MRCASLSVGIVAYAERQYRESEMRLRYSVNDATAFHRYATHAWPSNGVPNHHHLLTDGRAVGNEIAQIFHLIAIDGPLDLFFLYLSGHGETAGGAEGWFCLADARVGNNSLDGPALDRLLRQITADQIVLIVDCCYAEAVAKGMTFFSGLNGAKGRLFVASARANQQAWEDDELQRSLFSDVLLGALSTDSKLHDAAGLVDVEARLFPHLREQVPLLAASKKRGNVQEPVTGGFAATSLKLPTVASRSLGRPMTVAQAVTARVRRVFVGSMIAAAIVLMLLELLVFHVGVASTGEIVVRPGLHSTFALLPVHLATEVNTGLTLADFDPRSEDALRALANGTAWGFITQTDERGLRTWLSRLEPSLREIRRASIDALASGHIATFNVDNDPAPLDETGFVATLAGRPWSEVAVKMYPNSPTLDVSCAVDPLRRIDFAVLQPTGAVFGRDAMWLAATAPRSPAERSQRLALLVRLAAYRTAHASGAKSVLDEFGVFAAATAIVARPLSPADDLSRFAVPLLRDMLGTWCAVHAAFALGVVGDPDSSQSAETALRSQFESFDRSRQDDLPTETQALAVSALGILATRRPLSSATLEAIMSMIERDGGDLAPNTPATALLTEVAAAQRLPERLTKYLFGQLSSSRGQFDFSPLAAGRILSRNARFLDEADRSFLIGWLRTNAVDNRTMSDFHEALGFAALTFPLDDTELGFLTERLSPETLFPPRATDYRGAMIITASGDAAAVALGRVAQTTAISEDLRERIANFAAAHPDLPGRAAILRGLATQWYSRFPPWAQAAHHRLINAPKDPKRHNLELDVASMRFADLAPGERDALLHELLILWKQETEPQVRIALARLIARTSLLEGVLTDASFVLGRTDECRCADEPHRRD